MPSVAKSLMFNITFSTIGFLFYQITLLNNMTINYFYILSQNILLLTGSHYLSKQIEHYYLNKKYTGKDYHLLSQIHWFDLINLHIVCTSDLISLCITKKFPSSTNNLYFLLEFISFIGKSFIFEIIFDFFHYWTHRIAHHRYLYKYSHKKHHEYNKNTNIITTFHQDFFDLLFTNVLPMYLTSQIIPFTQLQYCIFLVYKTFIEIGGHLGKESTGLICFPQFVWLPKLFNIQLYSIDHYHHHTKINYNYSKRFMLWDKIFGSHYKIPIKVPNHFDKKIDK